jgi:hypothetical protein
MLLKFDEFEKINEQFSNDSKIVNFIIDELNRHFNPNSLIKSSPGYGDNSRTEYRYCLDMVKRKITSDDPYGEEPYGEPKRFHIQLTSYKEKFKKILTVNGIEMNVSYFKKSQLEKIFNNYEKRMKKERKKAEKRREIEEHREEIIRIKKEKEDLKKSLFDFKSFESLNNEEFYVLVRHNNRQAILSISKYDNRWHENVEVGDKIFGGKAYIGNMTPKDIERSLKNNYDEARIISEDELLDLI